MRMFVFVALAFVLTLDALVWAKRTLASRADATGREARAPRNGAYRAPVGVEAWRAELGRCAKPGPNVRRFVGRFGGKASERLAGAYSFIAHHWRYEADVDADWLTPAEDLLAEPDRVHADCKAVAVALAAAARALNIDAQMIATAGRAGRAGHVQTRVLIAAPGAEPRPVLIRLLDVWHAPEALSALPVDRIDGWTWLVLDGGVPPRRIDDLGPIETIVAN